MGEMRRAVGASDRNGTMDPNDEGVLEAARAIRPYLTDLVESPHAAAKLDRQLADELGQVSDPPAAARRLRILLEQHEDTAWFLGSVLADAPDYRPPHQQPRYLPRGGIASPLGDAMPIAAARYNCPVCGNYVWYRPDIGTAVPRCPTDDVLLTQA
jgi:hypothetical protein